MEKKVFSSFMTKADDTGIVEAIVAVMGNVDDGGDVIHPGSFVKTITERIGKIKVLDAHRTDSTSRLIGKPLEARELSRAELPAELLQRHPDASGGLWTKTQFLIDTPEGSGAFKRIKAGVLDEWSIGYDALDTDFSKITKDGKEITVRNLRTIKLYEYSPVLWAMNPATATLSAKDLPSEGKPYRAIEEDGVWRVYKLDEDGEPTGEPLGEHETEDEAQDQVRALYANEGKSINLSEIVDSVRTAFSHQFNGEQGPWLYWTSAVFDDHVVASYESTDGTQYFKIPYTRSEDGEIAFADRADWVEGIFEFIALPKSGRKAGRVLAARNAKRILDAMTLLHEALVDAGLMDMSNDEDDDDKSAPKKAADLEPDTEGAGPDEPPTSNELIRLIEIEQEQLKLLEV